MSENSKDASIVSQPEKVKNLPISQDALDHLADEKVNKEKNDAFEDTENIDETDSDAQTQSSEKSSLKPLLWIIVVLLLIFLILLFSRYFLPSENPAKTVVYNTYEFKKADGDVIWYTSWNRNNITHILPFRHTPFDVENISQGIERLLTDETLRKELSAKGIEQAKKFKLENSANGACSKNETLGCFDRPIVSCDTESASVIYLKKDPETKIILDGNCMTIQGNDNEIVRATDRILFQWYHIINLPDAG